MSIELVVTSGVFSLDGQDFDVDNNVWIVGDASEALVVDAAHDADAIAAAVGDRRLVGIVCTHGHNDHINAAAALAERFGAPVHLHPRDRMLWDVVYPERAPDRELADGEVFRVAGTELRVVHTPGHAPGAVCLYA
ncbi:MAG: MBL fold metallo-hydrolase, partial [Streptomycetaceae bacterium]|nr:MBL fold metallo-hydrolase [Streptomycetaceae bacterium]